MGGGGSGGRERKGWGGEEMKTEGMRLKCGDSSGTKDCCCPLLEVLNTRHLALLMGLKCTNFLKYVLRILALMMHEDHSMHAALQMKLTSVILTAHSNGPPATRKAEWKGRRGRMGRKYRESERISQLFP